MNLRAYIVMVEDLPDGQHVTNLELDAQAIHAMPVDRLREHLEQQWKEALTQHNDSPRRTRERKSPTNAASHV